MVLLPTRGTSRDTLHETDQKSEVAFGYLRSGSWVPKQSVLASTRDDTVTELSNLCWAFGAWVTFDSGLYGEY